MEVYKCQHDREISYEILKTIENTNIPVALSLKMENVNAEKVNFELTYRHLTYISLFLFDQIRKNKNGMGNQEDLVLDDIYVTFIETINNSSLHNELKGRIILSNNPSNNKLEIHFSLRLKSNEYLNVIPKTLIADTNSFYEFIQSMREDIHNENVNKIISQFQQV